MELGDQDSGPLTTSPSDIGLAVRRLLESCERAVARLQASERACTAALGAAMTLSVALGLWLTRGTVFFSDEFTYFVANRGFELKALLAPHNGHLIAVVRLIYATVFKLFGADYLVFRLLEALGVVLVSGLFFVYAKRRVGAAVALAPSVLLLFLGSSPDVTLTPLGITHVYCVAAGLGALLALDREDTKGDLAACGLVTLSVATFSIGLAFLAGVAVSVLLREDRRRRAWIFLIPGALFGAWLLAPKLSGPVYLGNSGLRLSNALLLPNFVADAGGAVVAVLTGLSHDFSSISNAGYGNAGSAPDITSASWGYVAVALGAWALVIKVSRGGSRRSLWASLAVLIAFWGSTALVLELNRYPWSQRYVYAGAVATLLVAADALAGLRLSPRGLLALLAATVLALGANLSQFGAARSILRSYSTTSRAVLSALELARERVAPNFAPLSAPVPVALAYVVVGGAGPAFAAVDRNGSFAFSLPELREQPESAREVADSTLIDALRLRLVPATPADLVQSCSQVRGAEVRFRSPGILLRSAAPQTVTLGRFGSRATVGLGTLSPAKPTILRVPPDAAPEPWHATLSLSHGLTTICNL